jgi:hypothetical protein
LHIPKPPWYEPLEKRLAGSEWLVDSLLVIVIILCVLFLLKGDRIAKTTLAVYLFSP